MNIISSKHNANAVSLKQLIPQHETLKLLVLHTPFPLEISTLPQCHNLVKLDISRNNIRVVPYIGNLKYLRIAFLHQNMLGINEFIKIFEHNGETSILSQNIVWITFWGNKNVFLARHYTINKTRAIAFDKNIIVEEERMPFLIQSKQSFRKETDITDILVKKNYLNDYSTQQQYMEEFWITLRQLRLKYQHMNPIIKIQKIFRGWIFRQKLRREFIKEKENYMILYHCFKQWKNGKKKEDKLNKILKQSKKTYLLFQSSKINRQYINNRLKELALTAKNNVLKRRLLLQHQIRFYSILKSNFQILQDLYEQLQIKKSKAIYIYKEDINEFIEHVTPFVKKFCSQPIQDSLNQYYHLHYLYQPISKHQLEFLKMIKSNRWSIVSYEKPIEKMLQIIKFKKPAPLQSKMKAIFGNYHINTQKKQKMHEHQRRMQQTKKQQRDQLLRIEGSYDLLRTIVRGTYFYNSKRLNLPAYAKYKRINILSERSLIKISSAVSIQRAWKGYIFRKRHQHQLKIIFKFQKSATIIQRWLRRQSYARKKYFLFEVGRKLNECLQSSFFIDFDEYLQQMKNQKARQERHIMLEQHAQVYRHKQTGDLVLAWDDKSKHPDIATMINIKKGLFNIAFLINKIGLSQKQLKLKTTYASENLERCDFAYLFHYKTQTSLIKQYNKTFIHIECHTKSQARFRMLGISLLTFNFKQKKALTFFNKSQFMPSELRNKLEIFKNEISIICNQNLNFIKTIEQNQNKNDDLCIYMIKNKIFLQYDISKKPFKVQQRFFIYMINHKKDILTTKIKTNEFNNPFLQNQYHNRYETPQTKIKASLTNIQSKQFEHLTYSANIQQMRQQREHKILIKKRSIKQFNAKIKRRKQFQPNFIIDNKSTDRVTQNQSNLKRKSDPQLNIQNNLETPKNKDKDRIRALIMHDRSQRSRETKKQQQKFLKKFVNLGNFMQNQLINDHRRRMKTQIEHLAHVSVQQVRLSVQRSTSQKEEHLYRKYVKARQLQHIHRSLIKQNQALGQQRSLILRHNAIDHNQKSKMRKKQIRKPKITFAQQHFPLVHTKIRNISID